MSFYDLNPNRRGEPLACELETLDDYRVLRRLPKPEEIWCRSMPAPNSVFRLAVVDCETTGLDPDRHRMIEFAVGILSIDLEEGDVVDVIAPCSWLEDPGEDLPLEIERLTHITSNMLISQSFPDRDVTAALRGVDAIVAHNAKFDRSFVTRRFPSTASLPWICSMSEFDWSKQGFCHGRSISGLLTSAGFFLPDAHRAGADVWATTCLLAAPLVDGRTVAAGLVQIARQKTYRLYATKAPFEYKDVLKAAGYRWSVEHRAWWTEGTEEIIAHERAWLAQLAAAIQLRSEEVDWFSRHL